MDDIQGNGNVEVDLNNDDDDDDMFKSARGLEPEPAKREVNLFGEVDDEPINTLPGNSSPDMMDKEIPLEDEDEKPFEVRINITLQQLQIFIFPHNFSITCHTCRCNYIENFFYTKMNEQVFFIYRHYSASLFVDKPIFIFVLERLVCKKYIT